MFGHVEYQKISSKCDSKLLLCQSPSHGEEERKLLKKFWLFDEILTLLVGNKLPLKMWSKNQILLSI